MISDECDVDAISLSSGFQWTFGDPENQTKVAKAAPKRAGNYNHEEDIQLCVSSENISTDPIIGMSSQGEHIGKEFQIIIMPTRPLSQIGMPTHLSTVVVPFKRSARSFKDTMMRSSVTIQVAYHTRSM